MCVYVVISNTFEKLADIYTETKQWINTTEVRDIFTVFVKYMQWAIKQNIAYQMKRRL